MGVQINEKDVSLSSSTPPFFSSSPLDYPAEHVNCSIDMYIYSFLCRREGPLMLPKLHEGSIAACHMSDDAKLLVTGGYDLRVVLWDLENMTHKLVLRVNKMNILQLNSYLLTFVLGTSRLD